MKKKFALLFLVFPVLNCFAQQTIELNHWKFKTGDNLEWAKPAFDDATWKAIKVGEPWESQGYADYDGYAWYRISFKLSSALKKNAISDTLRFVLGKVDDCDQTFLNGSLLGQNGKLLPVKGNGSLDDLSKTELAWNVNRNYDVPTNDLRLLWDQENVLAVRVFDGGAGGGISGIPACVRMKDLNDYMDFDVYSKMMETGSDGTMSKTIILKNNSLLSELSGKLSVELTYFGEKRPFASQTFDVNMKGKEGVVTMTFKGEVALMIATCRFTDSKTGVTVVRSYEFMDRWTEQKANDWYKKMGWMRGCNFIPSTAINQLEMWQADTFDPTTIDRELGWAESIGFNLMRVFLHHKAWLQDPTGFKDRMDQYLTISDKHHIKTMFVLFDDCWNETSHIGKQPDPQPGIHNSGWVQDPGTAIGNDTTYYPVLEWYVKDVMTRFGKDKRVAIWDLYNEPIREYTLNLIKYAFSWARSTKPVQPLISCFFGSEAISEFQKHNVDLVSFHNYDPIPSMQSSINKMKVYNRPIICTEYMARTQASTFQNILPLLKKENVTAINWGLVTGKTNTKYSWQDKTHTDGSEPELWFHDIFRKDGTPYKQEEIDAIRRECFNK